jgi:hypothetical protein
MLSHKQRWLVSLLHALPLILLVSALFYYWFAVVDRFVIFLYGHLGAKAFDAMTNGRYWMAGLVAGGIIMVLYTVTYTVIGQIRPAVVPSPWWQVWLCAAAPLAVIIPAIVMNMNQPTLPLRLALVVTAVAILALALALPPATIAARSPAQLGWLLLAGMGIMPSILMLRAIELPQQGLVSPIIAYAVAIGSTIAGIIWSLFIAWIFVRCQQKYWTGAQLFAAGLQISYLLLPLTHYLLMTPSRYRYISSSRNFFAANPILQLTTWGIALLACAGIATLQKKWYAALIELPVSQEST